MKTFSASERRNYEREQLQRLNKVLKFFTALVFSAVTVFVVMFSVTVASPVKTEDVSSIPAAYEPLNPYHGSAKQGTHGRFYIDDLFIDVAIYDVPGGAEAQEIIDAEDSAVFMPFGVQDCIGDHAHQGNFTAIRNVVPGETIARVEYLGVVTEFVCTAVFHDGQNIRSTLIDGNGNDVKTMNEGGLVTYTCNNDAGDSVTIAYWTQI